MKKCPHCHTSMLLDYVDTVSSHLRQWKCLGCGREFLYDADERATDERLLEGIRRATGTPRRA